MNRMTKSPAPTRVPRPRGYLAWVFAPFLLASGVAAGGSESRAPDAGLDLSPDLMALLREEMRALAGGLETLATAIPTADWKTVAATARQMEASYIMKQRLTAAQKEKLHGSLPEHFKRLDAAFHGRAGRLAEAAAGRDADLVAFQFYRLVDACIGCHGAYAASRFPGFGGTDGQHPEAAGSSGHGGDKVIELASPRPDEAISSPLEVTGRARGSWYFEGDFPVILTDWDGRIIAETHATAQGPWMTTEFVPFTATVRFDEPEYGERGFLILRKANPSGLPEHDDALEIRVRF